MALRPRRPLAHAREARRSTKSTHKLNWIRALLADGREPSFIVLQGLVEGTSRGFLGFVESCYIKSLKEIGHKLTNGTDGGDGGATRTGCRNTPEHNALVSQALMGHLVSAETRAAQGRVKRGKILSESHCQHISESLVGKERPSAVGNQNAAGKRTKQTCQNISDSLIGKSKPWHIGNTYALGLVRSDETRVKMGAWQKGKPKSEAHRASLRAAWIKRKARNI